MDVNSSAFFGVSTAKAPKKKSISLKPKESEQKINDIVSENKSKYSSNRGIVYPYKSSSNSSENAENSKKSMEEEKKIQIIEDNNPKTLAPMIRRSGSKQSSYLSSNDSNTLSFARNK